MIKEINGMIIEDGRLINGCNAKGDVVIPDEVNKIEWNSFSSNTEITSIIIPDNVTYIGSTAFYDCKNLKEVKLSDKINYIGSYTFAKCINLKIINIPKSIEILDTGLFSKCIKLESIIIPKNIKTIEYGVFEYCKNLNNVIFEDFSKIKYINPNIFINCHNLLNIKDIPLICPEKDSFIVYSKYMDNNKKEYLIELEIPENSLRTSGLGNKCKCEKAKVISIITLNKKQTNLKKLIDDYDERIYEVGDTIEIFDKFDTCRWNYSSSENAMYFFVNKEDAINYKLGHEETFSDF